MPPYALVSGGKNGASYRLHQIWTNATRQEMILWSDMNACNASAERIKVPFGFRGLE